MYTMNKLIVYRTTVVHIYTVVQYPYTGLYWYLVIPGYTNTVRVQYRV